MHELYITSDKMPVMIAGDYRVAAEPFLHMDRLADYHVLIYVTEGAIYVTEDEIDYTIHPGEILFLKAGVHHYGKTVIEAGTAWYYAHFYLSQEREPVESEVILKANHMSTEESLGKLILPKKLTEPASRKPESVLKECIELFHGNRTYKKWMANASLFHFLSECAFNESQTDTVVTLEDKICDYLSKHVRENFSAKEVSDYFYLSYKHLAAIFKKKKGMSMQQYHNVLRMQEACRLLRSTGLLIGEISADIGFTDPLYFSKCFHQTMGCSPKQYRRELEY